MKLCNSIVLFLCMFLPLVSNGKNYDKEFRKIIQNHDIPQNARELPSDATPNDFWKAVLEDNPLLLNLTKDISKGKGAEKEALHAIGLLKLVDYRLMVDIVPDLRGFCDTLMINMGLPNNICEVNVIYDPTPNAFTTLTDNGFAICLNFGLLKKLEYDYARIMAVTAHEFAHGAMFHHLRTEYELAKKKRKDKIVGGIAAGLTAVSAGVDAYTSAILGTEYDPEKYDEQIENIAREMKLSSIKFKYKYNRSEELEADLIALRFMEHMGFGRKYQEALQMISSSSEYFWYDDEYSDHPATIYRLEFLDFVSKNPEYGSEVKLKNDPKPIDRFADPLYD